MCSLVWPSLIIGEDPASQVYVRNKKRTAEACGFNSIQHTLPEDVSQAQVLALIDDLNTDPAIHGILVQLPIPDHLHELTVTQSIVPEKDVDGFHFQNIGMLTSGNLDGAFVPCTPAGCMLMIEDQVGKDLSGSECGDHRSLEHCWKTNRQPPAKSQCNRDDLSQSHKRFAEGGFAMQIFW